MTKSSRARVERIEHAVIEHLSGVKHRAQRMLGGDRVEQVFEPTRIRGVAGGHRDLSTKRLQLRVQRPGVRGVFAAAAQEQEVTGAVRLNQVASEESADATGATGDQNRRFGVDWPGGRRFVADLDPRQPSRENDALPQSKLRLVLE